MVRSLYSGTGEMPDSPWQPNRELITAVVINDGIASIDDNAFTFCENITSVTIPNSVTYIGLEAFARSGLKSITIPSSVTNIVLMAFMGCSSLTSIEVVHTVQKIAFC